MVHFFKFYVAIIGRAEEAELQTLFQAPAVNTTRRVEIYEMLFASPEGKPSAQSAVSPTFATGKLNEPTVPKNQQ